MKESMIDFNKIIEDAEKLADAPFEGDYLLCEERGASPGISKSSSESNADPVISKSSSGADTGISKSSSGADTGISKSSSGADPASSVYLGDNIDLLKFLFKSGTKPDLIYIDPPFFSDSAYDAVTTLGGELVKFKAYDDRWSKDKAAYLTVLAARLILMKRILADTGLIWLHLDWHVEHYAKVLMDIIFGEKNFVNEIIWTYKSGGSTKRHFARKHDDILVYAKSDKYKFNTLKEKSYNRDFKPYRFKGVEEFQDETGWYTVVNMKDVWEIDMVGRTSSERTGYATQKPEKLMERIIESSSDPGDLCCDFFSGSGAFASAASKLGRRVIASDISRAAVTGTFERIKNSGARLFIEDAPDAGTEPITEDSPGAGTEPIKEDSPGAGTEPVTEDAPGAEDSGTFDVELEAEEKDGFIYVSVSGVYESGLETFLDAKALKKAEAALDSDPVSFIKGMSIGEDKGDGVHREETSDEGALIRIKKEHARVFTVKVWDVLGNFVYKSIVL